MNCQLIEECIELLSQTGAISKIINNALPDADELVARCGKRYFKKRISLRRAAIIFVAAAIIAGGTIAAFPAIGEQIAKYFTSVPESLSAASDESMNTDSEVRSLYAAFDELNTSVNSEEDIDLSALKIYAVYKNGEEKQIPLSQCTVTKQRGIDENNNKLLVIVSYKGCAFSIIYTLEGEK